MKIWTPALALGALSTALCAPAIAAPTAEPAIPVLAQSVADGNEVRTMQINVSEDDFATAEQLARLEAELRRASRKVCKRPGSAIRPSRAATACEQEAMNDADARMAELQMKYRAASGG